MECYVMIRKEFVIFVGRVLKVFNKRLECVKDKKVMGFKY